MKKKSFIAREGEALTMAQAQAVLSKAPFRKGFMAMLGMSTALLVADLILILSAVGLIVGLMWIFS